MDNNELALFNFEKSYSKDSSNAETKKELALCYHKKLDYVNALKYYDMALKSEPDNLELLANKALTLHAMDNYVAAIEIYKILLEKQPNERLEQNLSAASIAYGYDLLSKQDYGQAILYFEDAIDLSPNEASAYFGFAQANDKMGCTDIALANYEKAVSLAPANIEYNTVLKDFKTNHKIAAEKQLAQTKSVQTTPIESTPQTPEVKTETPAAEAVAAPVVTPKEDKQPQVNEQAASYDSLIKLGDEAYKKQNYNEAIDYYTKAVVFVPQDKVTMLKIANTYKLLGNNTKAVSFYDKLLTIDPNNTDAYFNKGLVLASQKNYDDCIKCFEKVIELSPDYPYAYYSLGLAYEQKNDTQKALEYYYLYAGIEKDEKMLNVVNQKIKALEG